MQPVRRLGGVGGGGWKVAAGGGGGGSGAGGVGSDGSGGGISFMAGKMTQTPACRKPKSAVRFLTW